MSSKKSKGASLKDGIVEQIGEQIKALQLGKQNADASGITDYKVTSKNIHLQCLLDLLDHVMLHGLDNVENGYWPFVVKLTHSATVNLISKHPQVTNDLDKGRVWVFVAVCEGLLESYIRLFLEGQKSAKKFYTKESFLRDKERLLMLLTLVSGLDYVDFALDLNSPYLGYGGLPTASPIKGGGPSSNHSPTVPQSRSQNNSVASSRSSSVTLISPSTSNETIELTDNPSLSNDVTNHYDNMAVVTNQNSEVKQSKEKSPSSSNKKADNTDRSLSPENELFTLMDPKFADVEEGGLRALNSNSYNEFSDDFRCRGGSNLSDISMDDPGILFQREQFRKKRIKKKKVRQRIDIKEESGQYYPAQGDREHAGDGDVNPNDPKVTTVYASYPSDYRDNDSESVGSAVSGDSLDQFCRDADFGSSLNLSTEVIVQSTVQECHNEQPTVADEKPDGDETGEEKPSDKDDSSDVKDLSSEYEGIILGLPKRPSLQDLTGMSCDERIDTNTLLLLSLEIFKHCEEQLHRMLQTSTGHQFGQRQCAHAMITDFAVYLLRKVKFREEASFHTDVAIEFSNVKSIEIGLNCQTVTVASKKEKFVITFGDEAVSRSFISSLTSQMSRASPSLLLSNLVSSSALQQESSLVKWMSKHKHLNMSNPNVACFSLVHWCGLTGPDSTIEVISYQSVMEGTLEFKSQNLFGMRSSRWTKAYFVLTNGTLWQYLNQNDKAARNMIDLRESRCGGCRQLHDADRPFAFEIVSSDGSGSLLVLSAQNEHEACEWIFKICQSIAESYDDESDRGCQIMKCVPSNLTTTKEKIVLCLSQPSDESEYKLITSCPLQNVTKIYVDNKYRNYCILKYDNSEGVGGSEGSWFVSFNSEFELSKFEHAIAEAWRELFQVDLQFLVLGNNKIRDESRERVDKISQSVTL